MGRGKIEIKRIENVSNRQVTYSKRKNGIIKKAREIAVLCDAQVSLVIISSNGRMAEFCSPSTTLTKFLDRYHRSSATKLWDAKHEYLSKEVDRIKKENDNMQIELRHLKGEDIVSLKLEELISLEEALQNGVTNIRHKPMELWKTLKKKETMLEEENKHLSYMLHQQEMAMDGRLREMENGYAPKMRDYLPQMPFAFRLQPMQPNLQDKK
uniref:MADS-box transcription factor PI-like 1 n=1 Tax=Trochodendron aralioides TaxID=4407 RepID=A5YBR8_TROAR|nr:MADS-box transcription factor PI-like 1 [Trochodendron aralioides]